ncbi:MAG TPA: Gfo/Idh/MocA family oxidoreductase [Candidatus Acidoferrum sp.]|nr:Gfo/Idh/MocA family oxidoreductase [Candidatus Acidoferrum sp.]
MSQPSKVIQARGATRREFLKKSTLAGAALAASRNLFQTPVYGQTQAPAPGNVVGANNRIVVGYIGVGLQGTLHVNLQKQNAAANNIAQAAVCDVSKHRLAEAKALVGGDCKDYADFERLLENKDIDAVTIATADQWHAGAAMAALQAGKHVYLEKPMARYLGEAFALYDLAKKTPGKIVQIGSQNCSDARWAKARELVMAGRIGKLVLGQESYMRNSKEGEWNADPYLVANWMTPEDCDWVKWEGKVKNKVPYNAERFVRWRKFYPYCAGPLGDLCPHRLHPLMLATGNPEFPSRVVCLGQNPIDADKNTPGAAERDCPEDVQLAAEFPSGYALVMISGTVNELGLSEVVRGHKATLLIGGNSVKLDPERAFSDDIDPATFPKLEPNDSIEGHEKNWFDCIRSNGVPNANVDLAVRVQTVLSLAEMSNRLNIMCLFDEKTRTITTGDGKPVPAITYGTLEKS